MVRRLRCQVRHLGFQNRIEGKHIGVVTPNMMVHRSTHGLVQDVLMEGLLGDHHPERKQIVFDSVLRVSSFFRLKGKIGLLKQGAVIGAQSEEAVLD